MRLKYLHRRSLWACSAWLVFFALVYNLYNPPCTRNSCTRTFSFLCPGIAIINQKTIKITVYQLIEEANIHAYVYVDVYIRH